MNIPNSISIFRFLMVPILLVLAWTGHARVFLILLVISFLSDVVDGVIARRLNLRTKLGARLDSFSDFFMYCTLGLGGWMLWPEIIQRERIAFTVLAISILLPVGIGLIKFRQATSYHTWAVKLSAVLIVISSLLLFVGGPSWPFYIAVPVCAYAGMEQVLITLLTRGPLVDTPTLWHALRMHASNQ